MNEHDQPLPDRLRAPRRRRSSLLDRWIQEQRLSTVSGSQCSHASELADAFDTSVTIGSTLPNPYLAYPDMKRTQYNKPTDDVDTLDSFEILQEEEIVSLASMEQSQSSYPLTTPTRSRFQASLRHLHISNPFRNSHSPSASMSTVTSSHTARSRRSIFQLAQRTDSTPSPQSSPLPSTPPNRPFVPTHTKSSSTSTMGSPSLVSSKQPGSVASKRSSHPVVGMPSSSGLLSPAMPKWRPSVLGHFSSASTSSISDEVDPAPSRPSFSSTYSSITTTTEPAYGHSHLRTKLTAFKAAPSSLTIWSDPTSLASASSSSRQSMECQSSCCVDNASGIDDASSRSRTMSSSTILTHSAAYHGARRPLPIPPTHRCANADRRYPAITEKKTDKKHQFDCTVDRTKPYEIYRATDKVSSIIGSTKASSIIGSTKASSLVGSTRGNRKPKKLVISGIAPGEDKRLEGIMRWCQSFGDVKKIMRMPNGELVVEWIDNDVADTVCRLRAGVSIAGVGSVHLSWYQGKKR